MMMYYIKRSEGEMKDFLIFFKAILQDVIGMFLN